MPIIGSASGASMRSLGFVSSGIVATGGTITESGGYRIHTFTDSGTFNVVSTGSTGQIEYLVVAGGGGATSAGGGAGGTRVGTVNVQAQSYTVTVGAGGTGAVGGPAPVPPTSGTPSSIGTLIEAFGGSGGSLNVVGGSSGGSDAGVFVPQGSGPTTGSASVAGTPGQGSAGGAGGPSNIGQYFVAPSPSPSPAPAPK